MATNLLSFPFRVGPNGSAVTQEQSSPEYFGELIAQLVTTVPGERDQAPLYGISDPAFRGVDPQELNYKLELFGPPVQLVNVSSQAVNSSTEDVIVEFAVLDQNNDTADFTNTN